MSQKATYLVLDVETGGLDPAKHPLLTVGYYVASIDNYVVTPLHGNEIAIQSGDLEVEPKALSVNGISLEEHNAKASPSREALWGFLNDIKRFEWPKGKATIMGHNTPFDQGFMKAWFKREGVDWDATFSHNSTDTLPVVMFLHVYGVLSVNSFKLQSVAAALRIYPEKAHSALDDAKTTLQVFNALGRKVRAVN